MCRIKSNSDNFISAALFVVLVAITLMLMGVERKSCVATPEAPISSYVEVNAKPPAVVPASVSLPICCSFADEKHAILDISSVSDYLGNLKVSSHLNSARTKQILIKPLLSNIFKQMKFPSSRDGDYPSFS